ncbi:hypothetical protein A3Q56_05056 [Intoshia linei]|uniref:Uncharacterized protein n=1 Tax=Intoshia linei TaxID=1819745 RepID=A0A177AYW3_9BILA|nr:hypothetical protein A3Q56_05056 [Intoshia linei]
MQPLYTTDKIFIFSGNNKTKEIISRYDELSYLIAITRTEYPKVIQLKLNHFLKKKYEQLINQVQNLKSIEKDKMEFIIDETPQNDFQHLDSFTVFENLRLSHQD